MSVPPDNDVAPTALIVQPRITVIGVGGAGGNAIDNMIGAKLEGVEFVAANTDAQALERSLCGRRIQLGASLTHGLGAGSRPEIGQAAAEEANDAIVDALRGVNMAFITAGMGGGTGTGGAPVIARVAREQGVLAVGVVSKPFNFEGPHRMRQAEAGIAELAQHVDTLIVVPNQNLFRVADEKTTLAGAFKLADEVLHTNVRGVTDLMVLPGLVNLDFADVRSIMEGMGKAVMGTGEAGGDNRALAAAKTAISNPLLDGISMTGARSVLINITGGADLKLMEVDEAANRIRGEVDPDANIIFGSAFSETLDGKIRVSVIATGVDIEHTEQMTPTPNRPPAGHKEEKPDQKNAAPVDAAETIEPAPAPAEQARDRETIADVEADSGSPDAPVRPPEEPFSEDSMILQFEPILPGLDEDLATSPDVFHGQTPGQPSGPALAGTDPVDAPAAQSATRLSGDPQGTPQIPDGGAQIGDALPSFLAGPPEPQDEALLEQDLIELEALLTASQKEFPLGPLSRSKLKYKGAGPPVPKPRIVRPAKPVKSQSTLEVVEESRRQEETTEPSAEKMHYMVWQIELGARIYKVPEGKLDLIGKPPDANSWKLFEDLETAKVEANAIFKRVAADRTARGLPTSIFDSTLKDLMGREEKNVPDFFV